LTSIKESVSKINLDLSEDSKPTKIKYL
jgi:hypothetical protein